MKQTTTTPHLLFPAGQDLVLIAIETTGLRPDKDRIIAIDLATIKNGYIYQQWQTAINSDQADFLKVAKKLNKFLKNNLLIAHNAFFVYEFLQHEMQRNGLALNEEILCSISLSRFLFPEAKQHHLEAINERLPLDNQKEISRLQLLINFIGNLDKLITPTDLKHAMQQLTQSFHSGLVLDHKDGIPAAHGIYRFYDENDCLLYIGKSEALSETIASHFQQNNNAHKEIQLAKQIKKIDWIKTSGALGTALIASKYIHRDKPLFNRLVEKMKMLFAILPVKNGEYLALKIMKLSTMSAAEFSQSVGIFNSKADAEKLISFFINQSNLCFHINNFTKVKSECFRVKMRKCNGACNKQELPASYNNRVKKILTTFSKNIWPFPDKIAIKETCERTNDTRFHVIDQWTYLDTVKSLEKMNDTKFEKNKNLDENIYKILKNFLYKQENQTLIIKLK